MLLIPRSILRDFRAVCRRAFGVAGCRELGVRLQATTDTVTLRAATFNVALEYQTSANLEPADLTVKLSLLDACQSGTEDLVGFKPLPDGGVRAIWEDRGVPWQRDGEKLAKALPAFPAAPSETATNEAGFLRALADASECVDSESSRYALGCIQLRGETGRIAATDGRQVLVQNDYHFPWQGDVLIPANKGLFARELPQDVSVQVGQAGKLVTFVIGPWTIWLREHEGRFPRVEDILRNPAQARSKLTVDPTDAAFALDAIKRLPANDVSNHPVTLDLNGEVLIRALPEDTSPAAELLLARSSLTGEQVKVTCNRKFFTRAISMGLTRFALNGGETIVQAHDSRRQYAWMPLEGGNALKPGQELCRISSLDAPLARPERRRVVPVPPPPTVNSPAIHQPIERETKMPTAKTSEQPTRESTIEQAVAVRSALREALTKTNLLVHALKRHKRQSKLVESTLQSLKQLQVAG